MFDLGKAEGTTFITMEFVPGEDLPESIMEAKVLVEGWRKGYNRFRPHSSLGYWPPAPEAYMVGKFAQRLVLDWGLVSFRKVKMILRTCTVPSGGRK